MNVLCHLTCEKLLEQTLCPPVMLITRDAYEVAKAECKQGELLKRMSLADAYLTVKTAGAWQIATKRSQQELRFVILDGRDRVFW